MTDAENIQRSSALGSEEHDSIVLACLKCDWSNLGIVSCCQNNPQTPHFDILASDDLCSLREYFRQGRHRLREGVVYRDLAFVQQVDAGDEWLALKREFDDDTGECFWVPFESVSFEGITKTQARFDCAISALRNGDPYDTAVLFDTTPTRQRQSR